MIDALKAAYAEGSFKNFDDFLDPEGFARLVRTIAKLDWIVYAKPAFSRGEHVLQYLGRYTHRVAISNSRLLDITPEHITFRTKGDGTETLHPVEFLRRFVGHVLPDGFHKIRHVGLHASIQKRRITRTLLGIPVPLVERPTFRQRLAELTGRDIERCPVCGDVLRAVPLAAARAPPAEAA
jgi:Putative transposase